MYKWSQLNNQNTRSSSTPRRLSRIWLKNPSNSTYPSWGLKQSRMCILHSITPSSWSMSTCTPTPRKWCMWLLMAPSLASYQSRKPSTSFSCSRPCMPTCFSTLTKKRKPLWSNGICSLMMWFAWTWTGKFCPWSRSLPLASPTLSACASSTNIPRI